MQIYYFSRTGRSKEIAEELSQRYHTTPRMIDDHRDWSGKINYMKAGSYAMRKKTVDVEYEAPDLNDDVVVVFPLWAGTMPPGVRKFCQEVGQDHVVAVVTSLGSTLSDRDGFRKVFDVVGKEISAPEIIL